METERHEALSDRERQIARLAAEGLTDKEIARRLDVSITTVRTYWVRMRRKLGAANRAQAIVRALDAKTPKLEGRARFETLFRRLLDTSLLGILIVAQDGRVLDANDEFLRIAGCDRQCITDSSLRWEWPCIRSEGSGLEIAHIDRPDGRRVHVLGACALVEPTDGVQLCYALSLDRVRQAEGRLVQAKSNRDSDRRV